MVAVDLDHGLATRHDHPYPLVDQAPTMCGCHCGGGARTAGPGDARPALPHSQLEAVAGRHPHEVHVHSRRVLRFEAGTLRSQVDAFRVLDQQHQVRVADVEQLVALGGEGQRLGSGVGPRGDRTHVDLDPDLAVGVATHRAQLANSAGGLDAQVPFGPTVAAHQRLGQAADAVARDLRLGTVRVEQHHACVVARLGGPQSVDEPVRADTAMAIAHPAGDVGIGHQPRVERVERDEEVVAQPVVLGQSQQVGSSPVSGGLRLQGRDRSQR